MMKFLKFVVAASTLALGLAGCGGGGGSGGGAPNKTLTTTAPAEVAVLPGTGQTYKISGGVPPYRVSSSETQIVVGTVDRDDLFIGAVNAGMADVRVTDYANASLSIGVKVGTSVPLTSTAPSNLIVGVGASVARTFSIRGGIPPYTVEGTQNNVFSAQKIDANRFSVTGLAIGNGKITITDTASEVLELNVEVGAPELRVAPTELKLFPGIDAEITISGGQPPYRAAGGIPSAIGVKCKPGRESLCDQMIVTPKLASELEFSIADATGQLVSVKVEVAIGQATFGISPAALTVQGGAASDISLNIYGAADGKVCFFASPASVITVPACTEERSIKISGTGGLNICTGMQAPVATLTAVDSQGAIGVSRITVQGLTVLPPSVPPAPPVTDSFGNQC